MTWRRKWFSATMAAMMLFTSTVNVASAATTPAQGATYFQGTDNVGQGGIGPADGDLDTKIKNHQATSNPSLNKHPIEFLINVTDPVSDIHSAALLIRAQDVDEEQGEWDRVFFGDAREEIGNLSGNDSIWNTTVFYLDPSKVKQGNNYVEIVVDDRDGKLDYNWEVTIDWGQLVLNNGPKDEVSIDSLKLNNISDKEGRQIAFDVTPTEDGKGKTYIAEINLTDSQGNNVGTIIREITIGPDGVPVPVVADFNNSSIDPNTTYTANIFLFEKDPVTGEPAAAQEIWASDQQTFWNNEPVVQDVEMPEATMGKEVTFSAEMFRNKFADPDAQQNELTKVKLSSLPDARQGVLYYNNAGIDVQVSEGTELTPEQLDTLYFAPAGGWNGTEATFQWNGYDGSTYAKNPANVKFYYKQPEVKSAKIEDGQDNVIQILFDEPIQLEEGLVPNGFGTIVNGGEITVTDVTYRGNYVYLHLPNNVRQGDDVKISYNPSQGTVTDAVYNPALPIQNYPVANGVLDKEAPQLQDAVVEDSNPQQVKLTFNEPIQASDLSGITVTVDGKPVQVTGIQANGQQIVLTLAEPIEYGDDVRYTYDPSVGNVKDRANNNAESANNFPVRNLVLHPLDGWVGSRAVSDTSEIFVAPGEALKLSAVTTDLADKVTAVLFPGEPAEQTVELKLVETKPGYKTWANVNYRLPDQVRAGTYTVQFNASANGAALPAETAERKANNVFHVVSEMSLHGKVTAANDGAPIAGAKVTVYEANGNTVVTKPGTGGQPVPFTTVTDANGNYSLAGIPTRNVKVVVEKEQYGAKQRVIRALPTQLGQTDIVENFELSPFSITLSANPSSIVGDGESSTLLTAVIRDLEGLPLANTEVVFSAPVGSFANGTTENGVAKVKAVTNAEGKATVRYISERIEGIVSQNIPVTATVNDEAKGLHGDERIVVAFHPARISGIVSNTAAGGNVPVAGAIVRISNDFDGDGIIDFSAEAVTGDDGSYSIAVPRGGAGVVYDLEISKPVQTVDGITYVSYKQKAPVLQEVQAVGQEFDSTNTVTGLVGLQAPGSDQLKLIGDFAKSGKLKVYLKAVGGGYIPGPDGQPKAFPLEGAGVFNVDGVPANTEYEVEIKYVVSEPGKPDKELLLNRNADGTLPKVKVSKNGELNISEMLVDPYGTVTDGYSGEVIEGAKVELFYADTQRNKDNGRTPGTRVELPELIGFAPNNNASPEQLTDKNGLYAYMVYPETDYYLVVAKDGYNQYTSPVLSVEWDIVKHDVVLYPYKKRSRGGSGGGSTTPPAKQDISLNLSVDQNLVEEGGQSTIKVDYKNDSAAAITSGQIKITLPEGVEVVDAAGGKVDGSTVTWDVKDLAAGQAGIFKLIVKWPMLDGSEQSFDIKGVFLADGVSSDAGEAQSSLKMQVFSKRFETLLHQRYILGFPDGQFKADRNLTRAELAAIVARLSDNESGAAGSVSFSDVSDDFWAADYIAAGNGLFNGFEDGTFRPDAPITRGELVSVMTRFLKLDISEPGELHFSDIEGHWAASAIEELYRNKFVNGYPDGTFKPQNHIIRSEAVTMINRMLYRGPLTGVAQQFPDVPESHWAYGDVQEATVSHEAERAADGSEVWKRTIADDVK